MNIDKYLEKIKKMYSDSDNRQILFIRATAETREQAAALADEENVDTVFIDSSFIDAQDFCIIADMMHAEGKRCGLRLPQIWRDKAESYFDTCLKLIKEAGFDSYLFRNMESLLFFKEKGLLDAQAREVNFSLDHNLYICNDESFKMLTEMLETAGCRQELDAVTLPLELNQRELASLDIPLTKELVVYGRTPMMVSAQCVRKTVRGCDKNMSVMNIKDRTGAVMPVKNCCRICLNTIYNHVPTVLYDMHREIAAVNPDYLRYDFTTESREEVKRILENLNRKAYIPKAFTRGHFKNSVE